MPFFFIPNLSISSLANKIYLIALESSSKRMKPRFKKILRIKLKKQRSSAHFIDNNIQEDEQCNLPPKNPCLLVF
jgi:hypothetical protein